MQAVHWRGSLSSPCSPSFSHCGWPSAIRLSLLPSLFPDVFASFGLYFFAIVVAPPSLPSFRTLRHRQAGRQADRQREIQSVSQSVSLSVTRQEFILYLFIYLSSIFLPFSLSLFISLFFHLSLAPSSKSSVPYPCQFTPLDALSSLERNRSANGNSNEERRKILQRRKSEI